MANAAILGGGFRASQASPWRMPLSAAIANRNAAPVNILAIGTSITEGYPPSGVSANLTTEQWWQRVFIDQLRTKYPTSGVTGKGVYYAALRGLDVYPSGYPVTRDVTASQGSWGLGLRNVYLGGAGKFVSFTCPTGTTSVDICWARTSLATSFNWSINGGSATSVNTNGVDKDGNTTRVTGLTAGDVLKVEYISGAGVLIEGFFAYGGDETKGIRIWDAGHAAITANTFDTTQDLWFDWVTTLQPKLVIIELGGNDWQSAAGFRTPAQLKANVASIISKVVPKISASYGLLLMADWQIGVGDGTPWDSYRQVIRDLVAVTPRCGFFDLRNAVNKPDVNIDTAGGLLPDYVHPGPTASASIATALSAML